MKKKTIYWLDGTKQVIEGENVADAFTRAGFGHGALSAVDFIADGEDNNYVFKNGYWVRKAQEKVA